MGCDSSSVAKQAKNPSMPGMHGKMGGMGDMKGMMGGMPNMDMMKKMMSMSTEDRKKMMDKMPEPQKKMMMAKMKEMMQKMMPGEKMDSGWSKTLLPNPMVCKYIVEYFAMPARSSFVHGAIAAAKCWVERHMPGRTIETEVRMNTMEQWGGVRKAQTPHGFMPLLKEVYKCPMTGAMKESNWMDDTVDLVRRILKNAMMAPTLVDVPTFGCTSLDEVNNWLDERAAKLYGCFDGDVTALMDQDRGVMSNTTMDEKAEFSASIFIGEESGKLVGFLDTLAGLFKDQILKNGFTHPCTDKPFITDIMLVSWLRRHIYNPHLRKYIWPVVESSGHADWVQKFWEKHAPFIVNAPGGYDDTTKSLPIQIL